jgi:endoglucanase
MDKKNMNSNISLVLFIVYICLGNGCNNDDFPQTGNLVRGINLGNALEAPNEGDWGVTLEEEYFQLISNKGFDFIRVPIKWSAHAEVDSPYTIDTDFFERIDWVINQSTSRDLLVIINMHHYDEIFSEPADHRERFIGIWKQIAERYMNYPDELYFELLNEPHDNLRVNRWNEYLNEAIDIIRESNPERIIIVGPPNWNSYEHIHRLNLPEDDTNIIVTFHYYEPFTFTHQGADWISGSNAWLGTEWTGTDNEKQAIRDAFDQVYEWASENDRQLLLGEFGAYQEGDMASRVRWTEFIAREAESRDIAWAYWEFCAGFGIYDPDTKEWKDSLAEALIPQE